MLNAEEYDQFVIIINSVGGELSTACSIIEAIKSTDAMVRCVIVGECHSAASIIALNCHNIMVTDSATMMVHTANFASMGSTGQIKSHVDFSSKRIRSLLESTYDGFLTKEEMSDLHKGVEHWFDSKEIAKRLGNRIKIQTVKHEAKKTKNW